MSWSLDKARGIWKCTKYSDLNYAEITNLAEYGEPFSPYETGFDPDFVPDFGNVIVEMPQLEVMTNGYGKNITAETFPIVTSFLDMAELLMDRWYGIPKATHTFDDLVKFGFAKKTDRWIKTNLYGWGGYGITAGSIDSGDAAFIHGTVSIALMASTRFTYGGAARSVDAEIGAGSDNWDFNSGTIPGWLNGAVATIFGPDHYNLTGPIQIQYTNPGKKSMAKRP